MEYSNENLQKLNQLKNERKYIELMSLIAEINGGELLSKEYISYSHKYDFLFIKGETSTHFVRSLSTITRNFDYKYAFPQSILNIYRKNECKADKFLKLKKHAISLGGELLEVEWLGCSVKHKFKLYNEKLFLTPKEVYRSGLASPSRGLVVEPIIKQTLEHIFGYKFNKTRNILKKEFSKTKASLELDGYCKELKIAFEYQGHPSHWKKEHQRYEETIANDKLKEELCELLGITLIVIEYQKPNRYSDSDFFMNLLLKKCESVFENKSKRPKMKKDGFTIDMSKTHHYHQSLEDLKEKANSKGFELIDKEWKGCNHVYSFMHIKTKKIISMTSLRVKNTKRGLPNNIEQYIARKALKKLA